MKRSSTALVHREMQITATMECLYHPPEQLQFRSVAKNVEKLTPSYTPGGGCRRVAGTLENSNSSSKS